MKKLVLSEAPVIACPDLVAEATYGLPEVNRKQVAGACLVANPGWYRTAIQLSILPLMKAQVVEVAQLIADAKSRVSGAARIAEMQILFSEASDDFKACAMPGHRHLPEIAQGLCRAAGGSVGLTLVPHLTVAIRGIHATLSARLSKEIDLQTLYKKRYTPEPFFDVRRARDHGR